ncbi:MAG: hypothetical protein EP338_07500 [Bacteroidetes bacterium]|nr:MAG: hypothetical protein EP338_07500 [Bacteroidota bacterium]
MKKLIVSTLLILALTPGIAQMGLMVGSSFVKPFGQEGIFPGFHIGLELGQDDVQSFYGKFSFLPAKSFDLTNGVFAYAKDATTVPYSLVLDAEERFNFTVLEFGKRFYFGEGYDSGFSPYGGSNMQLIFNKVKLNVTDTYDQDKYQIDGAESDRIGSIFGLYLGLNGGLKKSFYFGTIYLDLGMSYALFAVPSNNVASQTENFKSLLFNFGLGFRKDFY